MYTIKPAKERNSATNSNNSSINTAISLIEQAIEMQVRKGNYSVIIDSALLFDEPVNLKNKNDNIYKVMDAYKEAGYKAMIGLYTDCIDNSIVRLIIEWDEC